MDRPALKRRRVRKGTRSCWECRRRKIKCRFQQEDDAACINCIEHETSCVSQKFSPDSELASSLHQPLPPTPDSSTSGDNQLVQRLTRLEELMLKLSERDRDGDRGPARASSDQNSSDSPRSVPENAPHLCVPTGDLFDCSAAHNAHDVAAASSTAYNTNLFSPAATSPSIVASSATSPHTQPSTVDSTSPSAVTDPGINHPYVLATLKSTRQRHRQIARDLHALFPHPQLRSLLAYQSPGASVVVNHCYSRDDQIAGRTEPHWSLASAAWPTPETHPVLIAKRLMQYLICMAQLSPRFDPARMQLPAHQKPCELIGTWIAAVTNLVTGDDEMVGCAEGIELLVLLSMFQTESGHLRRAWITTRRALNLASLLGIDRPKPLPIRSCATTGDPRSVPSSSVLWYRINCSDRYLSLILGLSLGTDNDDFSHVQLASADRSFDKLGREHAVICRKIADRNKLAPGSTESHSLTQKIENDLEQAANDLSSSRWDMPNIQDATILDTTSAPAHLLGLIAARSAMDLQIRHFTLVILLHLPYLLHGKDGLGYNDSRLSAMRASRAVLERFLTFRQDNRTIVSGRLIDYSGLIAAMTLLLGHLGQGAGQEERQNDRDLVERTLVMFRELGTYKGDRLSTESAETINQLLPIITTDNGQPVTLTVPSLGTVKINAMPISKPSDTSSSTGETMGMQPLMGDFDLDPRLLLTVGPPEETTTHSQSSYQDDAVDQSINEYPLWDASEPWLFQGVDTTYWSMLNQGFNGIEGDEEAEPRQLDSFQT